MKCVLTNGFETVHVPGSSLLVRLGPEGAINYFGIRAIGLGDSMN